MATEMNPGEQESGGLNSRRELRPGDVLAGKYRILEQLAEGGMGIVYVAAQEPMGRKVALKVMKQEMVSDKASVKRFFREAVAVSKLAHPNTIKIYDYGEGEGGRLYIVMEFLDGEPLNRVLKREGSLPLKRTVTIVSQIARALAEAHQKGVIHRDMKPENIFISKVDGGEDFVKVLDFGIAKLQRQSDGETKITRTGYVCGTPEYMSPEQARGEEDLDGGTDLYALGVMMWEMLEGTTPFQAATPLGIVLKHQTAPVPEMETPVPKAVKEFIYQTMSKDRADRPDSPEHFLEELLAACPADMEGWSASAVGATGRRDALVSPLALAATSDALPLGYTPTEPELGPAVLPASRGPGRWIAAAAVFGVFVLAGVAAAVAVLGGDDGASSREPSSETTGETLEVGSAPTEAAQMVARPTLILRGDPAGAEVVRDGAVIGVTPLALTGEPGESIHVELRKEGYEAMPLERSFPESGQLELAYTLPSSAAERVEITVDSTPSGARLLRDGALLGTTPHTFQLGEDTAAFAIQLELDAYEPATLTVDPSLGPQSVQLPLTERPRRVVARRGAVAGQGLAANKAGSGEAKPPPVVEKAPPATAAAKPSSSASKYKAVD